MPELLRRVLSLLSGAVLLAAVLFIPAECPEGAGVFETVSAHRNAQGKEDLMGSTKGS